MPVWYHSVFLLRGEKNLGWIVYILECGDGSFYTGITNDFPARLSVHEAGKGAKYTRGRLPLRPVYREECTDRGEALKRERAIKRMRRADKIKLMQKSQ